MTSKIKIGLMGFGNIGVGTYKVLEMNRPSIIRSTGLDFEIVKILERDVDRDRGITVDKSIFTQNPDDLFLDPEIHVIIELLGGINPAVDFMVKAMENGKHVVTANKAAIADSFEILRETAEKNKVMFRYEASVGGGIPVITSIIEALQANSYMEVMGILNGTTNYILTQMTDFDMKYEDVLKIAQEKGFAEADPTADVEGIDVANKLSILISLLFGLRIHPNDIPTKGITGISKEDIAKANESGHKIKLTANARLVDGKLEYDVKPTLVPFSHPLAGVNNEFNAIFIKGNAVGELMFYGKGAGPLPTGSAVMGDIIMIGKAIAKNSAYDIVVPGK
ncbi:MAG: homoserine dehydrogenase [Anaerovoracaceae bacterium]